MSNLLSLNLTQHEIFILETIVTQYCARNHLPGDPSTADVILQEVIKLRNTIPQSNLMKVLNIPSPSN